MVFKEGIDRLGPGFGTFLISPSDTVDFDFYVRKIYVGGTGNLVLVNPDGTTTLFSTIPAGTQLDVCARRVNATSTTATTLVGYY